MLYSESMSGDMTEGDAVHSSLDSITTSGGIGPLKNT